MDTPRRALIVIGGDDAHHDLLSAVDVFQQLASEAGLASTRGAGLQRFVEPLAATADASVYVLYNSGGAFPGSHQQALRDAVGAGRGVVALHMTNVLPDPDGADRPFAELLGNYYLSHGPGHHEGRHRVDIVTEHEITAGVESFEIFDEYYEFAFTGTDHTVLASRTREDGEVIPVLYVRDEEDGRVVYFALGHDMRSWGEPSFKRLVMQAIRWAGRA